MFMSKAIIYHGSNVGEPIKMADFDPGNVKL